MIAGAKRLGRGLLPLAAGVGFVVLASGSEPQAQLPQRCRIAQSDGLQQVEVLAFVHGPVIRLLRRGQWVRLTDTERDTSGRSWVRIGLIGIGGAITFRGWVREDDVQCPNDPE